MHDTTHRHQVGEYDRETGTFKITEIPAPPTGGAFARVSFDPKLGDSFQAGYRLWATCPGCLKPLAFGWQHHIDMSNPVALSREHVALVSELVKEARSEANGANFRALVSAGEAMKERAATHQLREMLETTRRELKKLRTSVRKRKAKK